METDLQETSITKRRLILRDSLSFFTLMAITIILFAVTLFLFRSFEAHRAELARRWSDRGLAAFQANQPAQAIVAFRTALSYEPDNRSNELMLAQSLGKAGRIDESYSYFLGQWETRPGDGFINLQLARLAATKRDTQGAINYYRASIYGTWEGDGVVRRREVRLELARYLIEQHELGSARNELLIAGGNAPDNAELDVTLAQLLERAEAPSDALSYYQKAIAHNPKNARALTQAGYLAYQLGSYRTAHQLLQSASRETQDLDIDPALLANSERILQLQPADALPNRERVARILTLRDIARKRLTSCIAQSGADSIVPQSLRTLQGSWAGLAGNASRKALLEDEDKQNATIQLIYNTEILTDQKPCATATGDDALLLLLAKSPGGQEVLHH